MTLKYMSLKISIPIMVFSILLLSFSANFVNAESVPEWIKNNALWYGQGIVSETEFLNAIKFLIENDIIILESKDMESSENFSATVIIPNGNSDIRSVGFYSPLNLEIPVDTTVTWINEDSVPHNIQSAPLNTGDRFEFTFEEDKVYNYYCSFHPWRVGTVTVK
jgi:plastocyanin